MKFWLATGFGFLLLASIPARADTTSDLAQCEKQVRQKTGEINGDNVIPCMTALGYALDMAGEVDELTSCRKMYAAGIEARCYFKQGMVQNGKVPAPLTAEWRTAKIDDLIMQEARWTEKCRNGGPSLFFIQDACNQRARAEAVLEARDWCRAPAPGKEDSEANKIWQACKPVNP